MSDQPSVKRPLRRKTGAALAAAGGPPLACGSSMRPWRIEGRSVIAADGDVVMMFDDGADLDNAALIVAAVNVFELPQVGYPPMREQLPNGSRVSLIPGKSETSMMGGA